MAHWYFFVFLFKQKLHYPRSPEPDLWIPGAPTYTLKSICKQYKRAANNIRAQYKLETCPLVICVLINQTLMDCCSVSSS